MYYKGKWCTAGGKDPLFGHVDGFQIDPKFRESKHKKCRGFNQLPGKWRYDIPSEKSRFRCNKMYTNAPRHTDMPGRYAFDNKTVLHKN